MAYLVSGRCSDLRPLLLQGYTIQGFTLRTVYCDSDCRILKMEKTDEIAILKKALLAL